MKNLTITYDTMQNGEVGEACVFIPMEDAQANKIKAAFEKSELLSKREAYDLRDAVNGCWVVTMTVRTLRPVSSTAVNSGGKISAKPSA